MYLEVSAMTLLELHRTLESDRQREMHEALRRGDRIRALASAAEASDRAVGVAVDDGPGCGSEASPDVGRSQDLDPGSGTEHRQRRLVRPVQAHPKS